jgi:heme/copper-type cytochrome/quinol oxidase subunit 2
MKPREVLDRHEGVDTVGTTLTPEFWRQFAVLLVIATAVTVVVSAALDALVLRMRARRTPQRPSATPVVRTHRPTRGTPVHH